MLPVLKKINKIAADTSEYWNFKISNISVVLKMILCGSTLQRALVSPCV